ncbi:hypothetical protein FIBSPDRAFT_892894 [Athelia psychrophila]|uniref:Uncharacterized protein n=1 Tax=Athelia psychrophila TaxID=1759441 RepID=A0A166HWN4_9AGAM|nr:hypothetical protein FIBSPDRAFT_892894 [Fibularhizoctonia sp. CBS 109695]
MARPVLPASGIQVDICILHVHVGIIGSLALEVFSEAQTGDLLPFLRRAPLDSKGLRASLDPATRGVREEKVAGEARESEGEADRNSIRGSGSVHLGHSRGIAQPPRPETCEKAREGL